METVQVSKCFTSCYDEAVFGDNQTNHYSYKRFDFSSAVSSALMSSKKLPPKKTFPKNNPLPEACLGDLRKQILQYWACLIALLLSLLPPIIAWDYGGALPWTQHIVALSLAAIGLISLPLVLLRRIPYRMLPLSMPVLSIFMVACGWLQTIPHPASAATWISPGTTAAYRDFVPKAIYQELALDAMKRSDQTSSWGFQHDTPEKRYPRSVCRTDTVNALGMPVMAGVVCLIVILIVRDQQSLAIVLWGTSIAGTLIALSGLFNLVRLVSAHDTNHSQIAFNTMSAASFGPFVNPNNAAGYLNMTLAATIGSFVWFTRRATLRRNNDPQYVLPENSHWGKITNAASIQIQKLDAVSASLLSMGNHSVCRDRCKWITWCTSGIPGCWIGGGHSHRTSSCLSCVHQSFAPCLSS